MHQGTAGLNHIRRQPAQNQGKVAMLPCGSWLENEQKDSTPADFDYAMFPLPELRPLRHAAVRHHAHPAAGEEYFVPAKCKNPRAGLEYMRADALQGGRRQSSPSWSRTLTVVKGAGGGPTLSRA